METQDVAVLHLGLSKREAVDLTRHINIEGIGVRANFFKHINSYCVVLKVT